MPEKTIKLKHPFTFEGEKIKEVTWRRLKGEDLIKSEEEMMATGLVAPGDATRTLYLVARAIDRPSEVARKMDLADYLPLAVKASDFL